MPMIKDDTALITACVKLNKNMLSERRVKPIIIPLKQLDLIDLGKSTETVLQLKEAGCTGIEHFQSYETLDEFKLMVDQLLEVKSRSHSD